jgi:hypothetical protein
MEEVIPINCANSGTTANFCGRRQVKVLLEVDVVADRHAVLMSGL